MPVCILEKTSISNLVMSEDRIGVSFMLNYPFTNANCSKVPHFRVGYTCFMPGMAVELLNLITAYLNLTIDVVKVTPPVSHYSITFEEISNNETDTYALLTERLTNYKEKLDFTRMIFLVCFFFIFII
jgi:hypothetical protein